MKHTIIIPDWTPPSVNLILGRHPKAGHKIKREAYNLVAGYCIQQGVPVSGLRKRRVSLDITFGRKGRFPDKSNLWKILLDGLVDCHRLMDDSQDYCEEGEITFQRGDKRQTIIILEDVE